jgi:hypothetical protein
MARTRASAPVDPFASARRSNTVQSEGKAPIFIAAPVLNPDGSEIYSQTDVSGAINSYCQGHDLTTQGKSMMEVNQPIIATFAMHRWAEEYVNINGMPENPKIAAQQSGGSSLTYSFVNRSINVTAKDIERLEVLVGKQNIPSCIVVDDVFTLNSNVLQTEVTIKGDDGKPVKDTVQRHITAALQAKFKDHPELLASLFTVKPVQQTAKDLIKRGIELVTRGDRNRTAIHKLVQFLQVGKFCQQIKPTGATE